MISALEEKRKRLRDEKDNENDIANGTWGRCRIHGRSYRLT